MTRSIHAIINPNAGGGYASNVWPGVKTLFSKYDLTFSFTEKHGDAEIYAEKAIEDENEFIAVVGGDGTINEVIQSCAGKNVTVIPMSAGTGSDFVRNFSVRREASIQDMIENNTAVTVDLGVAESDNGKRYFANIAEAGFGAGVMRRMNSHRKKRGGNSFMMNIMKEIINFRQFECSMTSKEIQKTISASEIIIANGVYFGGGITAAPDAVLNDGLLTVHIIGGAGRGKLLMNLRKLKDGSYIGNRDVISFTTKDLKLEGSSMVEMDGEDFGSLPTRFSIREKSLRVLGTLEKVSDRGP